MNAIMKDDAQLFKQFTDNDSFKKMLQEAIFNKTYNDSKE
jgi:type I restriction enzyme R subunit